MTKISVIIRRITFVALFVCLIPDLVSAKGKLHQWVDKDGVTHLTMYGPSLQARKKAGKISQTTRATQKKEKVRDTDQWDEHIFRAAEKYNIPSALVRAVIVAESNFDPMAISSVGAQGLMQLMPGTAQEVFVEDPHDPVQNIYGGTRYLRVLANKFGGDLVKTVAAYNAGPGAVQKAGGIPRIEETQDYVKKVLKLYRIYRSPT